MAPRARAKKVGLRRIDAAVDALEPFGFSRELVCKTVNTLLEVYGGDDGWRFIEEASYQLVIDTILEKQEERNKEEEYGTGGNQARASDVCERSSVTGCAGETSKAHESVGKGESVHINMAREHETCQPNGTILAGGEERIGHVVETTYAVAGEVGGRTSGSTGAGPSHLQTAVNDSQSRRKPCFGWISDEDSDNEDYKAEEAPAIRVHQSNVTAQFSNNSPCKKVRKSRWDV